MADAPPPPYADVMLALGIYNLAKCPDPTGDDCTSLLSSRSITSEGYHYELEVPCEDKGQAATLSRKLAAVGGPCSSRGDRDRCPDSGF